METTITLQEAQDLRQIIQNPVVGQDSRVSISATDQTMDFLQAKLTAGSNVSLTVENPGVAETLRIDADQQVPTPTGVDGRVLTESAGVAGWADAPLGLPTPTGVDGRVLTESGGMPGWTDPVGGGGSNFQAFVGAPGTHNWVNPGFGIAHILLIGAGMGGGSGGAGTSDSGGGGGAAGVRVLGMIACSDLPATVPVTLVAGGLGGAGVSGNANGLDGAAPLAATTFGTYLSTGLAPALATGKGGTDTIGVAGSSSIAYTGSKAGVLGTTMPGGNGEDTVAGVASDWWAAALDAFGYQYAGMTGGGGGGGTNGGANFTAGGASADQRTGSTSAGTIIRASFAGGAADGAAGTDGPGYLAGITVAPVLFAAGMGGSGGAGSVLGNGGKGGNGGIGGGGGGGGGSSLTGTSGAGGDGGQSLCFVWVW